MTQAAINAPEEFADQPLNAVAVEMALRAVEPGAVLVPLWMLQNLLSQHRGVMGSPFTVPRRHILVIDRDRLLEEANAINLPLPADLPNASILILLVRPEPEWLRHTPIDAVLRRYWRLLFHAEIDAQMRRKLSQVCAKPAAIESRIQQLGRTIFNEAKFVLQRDRDLAPDDDDRDVYAEFTAVFFEQLFFRPDLLRCQFPSITDVDRVRQLLGQDIDAQAILDRTRLLGSADALFVPVQRDALINPAEEAIARVDLQLKAARDLPKVAAMAQRADVSASKGNVVRSAILRMRIFRANRDVDAIQQAMQDLDSLTQRMKVALHLDEPAAHEWGGALIPVLANAAGGWWNPEGRLLYDLQKVCVAHEREVYSVGVVEWLLELCRRPLIRPQPHQRKVQIIKALRAAIGRLPSTRLSPPQRQALARLLHDALHHFGDQVRETLRPAIVETLHDGGIHTHSTVDHVAQAKLVEELLDGLLQRGYINMGNLRDTLSRNQVKLHDLRGLGTWLWDDQLVRIDRGLGDSLDGVYHRGEIYLRFFHRLSSPFFATGIGRAITRWVIMPVGGAFLALAALDHTILLVLRLITGWHWLHVSHFFESHHHEGEPHRSFLAENIPLDENIPFVVLSIVLVGVINWPAFAALTGKVLKVVGHALRFVFWDMPRAFLQNPAVVAAMASKPYRLIVRYLVKPLIATWIASLLIPRHTVHSIRLWILGVVYVGTNLVLNSTEGKALEQLVRYWLRITWQRITGDVVGTFRAVMYSFKMMLERVDRMLYAVDEWLRFRSGQSRWSLAFKAVAGFVWFYIAYITRFITNLLVEPQINPIKHVPVVTVSHKIIAPNTPSVISAIEALGVSKMKAGTIGVVFVSCIPGVFGFLAWELKENRRLYRANRATNLRPVPIGSHGESMVRLLRPGLHSGTVPKIFAKLRQTARDLEHPPAAEHAQEVIATQLEHAEHVREAVENLAERELAALLNRHPLWKATPVSIGKVTLSATRISIAVHCPPISADAPPMIFAFEQRSGWILAEIDQRGWLPQTTIEQRQTLSAALLGLYKIAGVDVVKEQIDAAFAPKPVHFELSPNSLFVWPAESFDTEWVYSLTADGETLASSTEQAPPLPAKAMLRRNDIAWKSWVEAWESAQPAATFTILPALG